MAALTSPPSQIPPCRFPRSGFDLKQNLQEETGAPKSDVLFDWRLDFRSPWGRHLLGALTAIHHRMSNESTGTHSPVTALTRHLFMGL
jgi:hypothetical protein